MGSTYECNLWYLFLQIYIWNYMQTLLGFVFHYIGKHRSSIQKFASIQPEAYPFSEILYLYRGCSQQILGFAGRPSNVDVNPTNIPNVFVFLEELRLSKDIMGIVLHIYVQ